MIGLGLGLPFTRTAAKKPTRGPELIVNGDFSAGSTGWTVIRSDATHVATFSGGTLRYQSDTTSPALEVLNTGALVIGKTYEVIIIVSAYASGRIKSDQLGGVQIAFGAGENRVIVTATATSFSFVRATTNVDMTLDSISIREVLG